MDFNQAIISCLTLSTDNIMGRVNETYLKENLCFIWSYLFKNIYGGEYVSLKIKKGETYLDPSSIENHAFVKFNEKYYDTQHPYGVEKIEDLFIENIDHSKYQLLITNNDEEFLTLWDFKEEKSHLESAIIKIKKLI